MDEGTRATMQPPKPPPHLMGKPLPTAGHYSESARLNMLEWQK